MVKVIKSWFGFSKLDDSGLSEEEKKRRTELLNSGFGQRVTEDITGDHDVED